MNFLRLGLMLLLAGLNAVASEGDATFQINSPEQNVTLLELYTSEGCSSCPPADRWLSSLKQDPRLWKDFIPLAFHVDYWNYLGWRDRFSSTDFSARQRQWAREGGARTVYTPGVFANGRDWSGWRSRQPAPQSRLADSRLTVTAGQGQFEADFETSGAPLQSPILHLALLGMNLSTDVRAGENRGKELFHDFVVLRLQEYPLNRVRQGYVASGQLPASEVNAPERALVAWVSEGKSQRPLLAAGGYWLGR